MEEKRRIVIPFGEEPETPHFDAEETLLSARPVVPLASDKTRESSQVAAPARKGFPFLALLVIVAVSIGMAAGLAIARYRYQQRSAAPVAVQPVQAPATNDARTITTQIPKESAQAPHLPEVKAEEKSTGDEDKSDESAKATAPEKKTPSTESTETAKDKQTEDNAKPTQPVVRDKKRTSDEEDSDDAATTAPRAQRRDRRQRNRDDDEDIFNVPRRVERTSEQINRIREIFEGRSRRP